MILLLCFFSLVAAAAACAICCPGCLMFVMFSFFWKSDSDICLVVYKLKSIPKLVSHQATVCNAGFQKKVDTSDIKQLGGHVSWCVFCLYFYLTLKLASMICVFSFFLLLSLCVIMSVLIWSCSQFSLCCNCCCCTHKVLCCCCCICIEVFNYKHINFVWNNLNYWFNAQVQLPSVSRHIFQSTGYDQNQLRPSAGCCWRYWAACLDGCCCGCFCAFSSSWVTQKRATANPSALPYVLWLPEHAS